ncbi:MAG TPA: fumarate hydratase [Dehalococcoidia bacterium]|nr:fumarate hydratase [Dehalococcoidia bacterium]
MTGPGTAEGPILALLRQTSCSLPADVTVALECALADAPAGASRLLLGQALRNGRQAEAEGLPLCEDPGRPVFFIADEAMTAAVKRAVRRARAQGLVGARPLLAVDAALPHGCIGVLVQGRSPRRAAQCAPVPRDAGEGTLVEAVARAVARARSLLCPPMVVGVGLGPTRPSARLAAYRALLRPVDTPPAPGLEERLLAAAQAAAGDLPLLALRLEGERTGADYLAVEFMCRSARRGLATVLAPGRAWAAWEQG